LDDALKKTCQIASECESILEFAARNLEMFNIKGIDLGFFELKGFPIFPYLHCVDTNRINTYFEGALNHYITKNDDMMFDKGSVIRLVSQNEVYDIIGKFERSDEDKLRAAFDSINSGNRSQIYCLGRDMRKKV